MVEENKHSKSNYYFYYVSKDYDALLLLTEWKEFLSSYFEEIKRQLKKAIIFDVKNKNNAFNLEGKDLSIIKLGNKMFFQ